jgi:hypothetical protein
MFDMRFDSSAASPHSPTPAGTALSVSVCCARKFPPAISLVLGKEKSFWLGCAKLCGF